MVLFDEMLFDCALLLLFEFIMVMLLLFGDECSENYR
jgi:hypothetical protein